MIQVKKGHSSIDNVIKNTPTSLDMFLQTNFDKIEQNCNENHSWGTLQLPDFCIGLNQLMYLSARTASLAKTDALSH